jgi:hypothetical protein
MEKLRQGPMLHLGVKGVDDDDDDGHILIYSSFKGRILVYCAYNSYYMVSETWNLLSVECMSGKAVIL